MCCDKAIRWRLASTLLLFMLSPATGTPAPGDTESKSKKSPIERMIADARSQAVAQFRDLRKPDSWRELLGRRLGPLQFAQTPTADAAKAVAAKLALPLQIAPGVDGVVTYDKDGTLNDLLREGIDPKYWQLLLKDGRLHLRPFISVARSQLPAERGMYYSDHPQELKSLGARCGARKDYQEAIQIDAAGAVTIRGRLWFIDKVKAELKIE